MIQGHVLMNGLGRLKLDRSECARRGHEIRRLQATRRNDVAKTIYNSFSTQSKAQKEMRRENECKTTV
jgi:hypothetical protein